MLLDRRTAVFRARPHVTLSDQNPFCVSVSAMDAHWIKRFDAADLERRSPYANIQAQRQALADGLVAFGGQRACLPAYEEDLRAILQRGRLFAGEGARMMRGRPCSCHSNVAALAKADPAFLIATGYALSDDGMWRQHSWSFHIRPRSSPLIETTEPRVLYFGFILNPVETEAFVSNNL